MFYSQASDSLHLILCRCVQSIQRNVAHRCLLFSSLLFTQGTGRSPTDSSVDTVVRCTRTAGVGVWSAGHSIIGKEQVFSSDWWEIFDCCAGKRIAVAPLKLWKHAWIHLYLVSLVSSCKKLSIYPFLKELYKCPIHNGQNIYYSACKYYPLVMVTKI